MKTDKSSNPAANILIGSMLFGLFFGAGNLIFPVEMGQQSGQNVLMATLGFLATGTGLPFLGVVAMGITGSKNVLEFGSRVHRVFGYAMAILLYLTIGPIFALPRTATVSFEVGLTPILPPEQVKMALAIFTVVFFAIALAFALKPTRILDWVGKFLNPIFLIFIAVLFIKAFLNPMGSASAIEAIKGYDVSAFSKGFIGGYQTMDALAALAFGSIVVENIKQFGYTSKRDIALNTVKSGLVSVILMCVIYGGLAWIGATSVAQYPVYENGGLALAAISRHYFGGYGSLFLSATITIACLKTAIGLITSCSNAFMEMFPNSFNYKTYAVIFAGFSCLVANVGLTQIIALAKPMLMLLYPPATVLIILSFFEDLFDKSQIVYGLAVAGSLIVGIVDAFAAMPDFISKSAPVQSVLGVYSKYVPLFDHGFGWLIFSVIGFIIGLIISKSRKKQNTAKA